MGLSWGLSPKFHAGGPFEEAAWRKGAARLQRSRQADADRNREVQPSVQGSRRHLLRRLPRPISHYRQRCAARPWLVHHLPRPPRHFLHHPRREGNRQAAGYGSMSAAGGEKRKPLQNGSFAVPAQLLLTIAEGLWYTFPYLGKNHVLPINGKWWQS